MPILRALSMAILPLAMVGAWSLDRKGRDQEGSRSQAALETRAARMAEAVQGRVQAVVAQVDRLAAAVESEGCPSEGEWRRLVREGGALPGLRHLEVVLRVEAKDMAAYEARLRAEDPKARVWDIQGGPTGPLGRRAVYFPIHRMEPLAPGLIHIDAAGRLENWSDIYQGDLRAGTRIGSPIRTIQRPDRTAVLLSRPLRIGGRGPERSGFITGVIDLPDLCEGLGTGFGWTLHEGPIEHPSTLLAASQPSPSDHRLILGFPVLQRVWTLRARGGADVDALRSLRHRRWAEGGLLVLGLGLTGMLGFRTGGKSAG